MHAILVEGAWVSLLHRVCHCPVFSVATLPRQVGVFFLMQGTQVGKMPSSVTRFKLE